MPPADLPRGLDPVSRLAGILRPPGSKSEAQRALLAAALAEGVTVIDGLPDGDDVAACLALVEECGVSVHRTTPARAFLEGRPPRGENGLAPRRPVLVGESGTLARLATAALALAGALGARVAIHARGSLLLRRSLPLFQALAAAGVEIARQNVAGGWPVELVACRPPSRLALVRPASSQEVSALLLAAAAHRGAIEVEVTGKIPSRPYVALTRSVLARFGVAVGEDARGAEATSFRVPGPLVAPREILRIEPDASAAAVALAGACLSGGELLVPGLGPGSPQGDVRIALHLAAFGCEARLDAQGLWARGFPRHGADLDLAGEPDLAPPLAAVAAGAARRHGARSTLRGLGTLPGKESDRLAVLAGGLARLGLAAEAGADFLAVGPGPAPGSAETVALDPRGDHRMAFAFALLGLVVPGVLVQDPGCVAKSWASFWRDLQGAGAVVVEGPAGR
ncbi:MAG: hypothetical protein AB1726_06610 [Planctomycetota bacterium]